MPAFAFFYIKLERKAYKAGTHTMIVTKNVKLEGVGRMKRLFGLIMLVMLVSLMIIPFAASGSGTVTVNAITFREEQWKEIEDFKEISRQADRVWGNRTNDNNILTFISADKREWYVIPKQSVTSLKDRVAKVSGSFATYDISIDAIEYYAGIKIKVRAADIPKNERKQAIEETERLLGNRSNEYSNITFRLFPTGFEWTIVPNQKIGPASFSLYREDINGPVFNSEIAFFGSIQEALEKGFISQKAFDQALALIAKKKYDSSIVIIGDNTQGQNAAPPPIKNDRTKELIRQVNEANKFTFKFRDKLKNYDVVVFKIPTGEEWIDEAIGGGMSTGHPVAFDEEPEEEPAEEPREPEIPREEREAAIETSEKLWKKRANDYDNITFKVTPDGAEWRIVTFVESSGAGYDLYRGNDERPTFGRGAPIANEAGGAGIQSSGAEEDDEGLTPEEVRKKAAAKAKLRKTAISEASDGKEHGDGGQSEAVQDNSEDAEKAPKGESATAASNSNSNADAQNAQESEKSSEGKKSDGKNQSIIQKILKWLFG